MKYKYLMFSKTEKHILILIFKLKCLNTNYYLSWNKLSICHLNNEGIKFLHEQIHLRGKKLNGIIIIIVIWNNITLIRRMKESNMKKKKKIEK